MITYAIYFIWNDGTKDVIEENGAINRDLCIKDMIDRKEFKSIEYRAKYKSGEYGKTIKAL